MPFRCLARDQAAVTLDWGDLRPQGEPAMSEQVVEERRGWASEIVWVAVYSILVLLVMLLWVYVPA